MLSHCQHIEFQNIILFPGGYFSLTYSALLVNKIQSSTRGPVAITGSNKRLAQLYMVCFKEMEDPYREHFMP